MATGIHPTAIVHKGALLEEDVLVGPFCVIGKDVRLGKGTRLLSHVVVEGITEVGENCEMYPFAAVGLPPQDIKYKGEETHLSIGSNNIIREGATIHRGSVGGGAKTTIGDGNFLMAYTHVAHDCIVGNHVVMANYSVLAGHVSIEDHVVMGGFLGVQQFCRVGAYAMIGGMSRIVQDVPPYVIVSGPEKAKLYGLNVVGLKRNGFSEKTIGELKKAYSILFREKLSRKEAIKKVRESLPQTEEIKHLVEFVKSSKKIVSR
jgi:UDP-N-acetylglucosamine acyltransferase